MRECCRKVFKIGRVSYERCCCGLAIPLMYNCLYMDSKKAGAVDSPFHTKIKPMLDTLFELIEKDPKNDTINTKVDELNKIIFPAGLSKEDKVCEQSVELFASLYGAEVGNFALKTLPYGGIYLLSTITLKLKDFIMTNKTFRVADTCIL